MKLRISILYICLIAALSVAGQNSAEKKARLIDSFGPAPNGHIRGVVDVLLAELANDPEANGIVYIRGNPAEIASRKRLLRYQIGVRKFDQSRIRFVVGRDVGSVRTDVWLVPAGATMPELKPEAWVAVEFGAVTAAVGKRKIAAFFADKKACSDQVYIINYGSPKQIAQREMWIRNTRISCGYDGSRVTLVNGGSGPVRTVMWLVPPGAENPMP